MKISVAKENLLHAVTALNSIVPAKSTMPILYNILIEASTDPEGSLKLIGTDLDISISYSIPATVEKAGSITIPARKLGELVRELPNSPITIEQSGDRAKITCGKGSFVLPGLPKADFPEFPAKSFEGAFRIANATIRKLVNSTSYAASGDDDRPILKGIFWEIGPEESSMVSTNGHRLAKMVCREAFEVTENISVIVPPKALEMVEKLFGAESTVEVIIEQNHLGIRNSNIVIFSRLIEGTYPNYQQVIPVYNNRIAILDTARLGETLRRMLILSNTETHRVRMLFKDDTLDISVRTEELGEGEETLEADYKGEELEIYFNGNYLTEVLRYIESDQVKICMQTSESGILMVPAAESESNRYLNVIMPLKVTE
jgi:DNA polymerase III subunit beta